MGSDNSAPVTAVLPYLIAINVVVGLLIVYAVKAFRSGRWVEEQTNAHADLQRQITEVLTETRRFVGELKESLAKEHELRREFIDRMNESFGTLSLSHARHDERIKALEKK